ncbi:cadmium-translocating P-type ATPase [Salipaludibacillus agaradhaerens]|nr:cadmium-translocating P-type ATPase [Salipaludibacillus agaradhaerens]MCR6117354.1 cadmium-translocating P-type ATPase [Salipaludibacillus agaradhaerens]
MRKKGKRMSNEQQFKIDGFSCANCAARFERNVKNLPGVKDAQVNFPAEKIIIDGEVSVSELEQAGAFENLKVRSTDEEETKERRSFWHKNRLQVSLSALLAALGWTFHFILHDQHVLPVTLFLISIIVGGYAMFWQGLKNIRQLVFDMKTLMTIAIIGAALIGEWGEAAVVVVLFAISEALETYSMDKARKSIRSLVEKGPKEARVITNGQEEMVLVEDVRIGTEISVRPGEKIPLDGDIIAGTSTLNEAAITGESIPVDKTIDDPVYAGTLNEEGLLTIRVTKYVKDTTLAKIIHLVEEAQGERAPAQQFIDKFASYYTPAIMLLSFLLMVGPPLLLNAPWGEWIYLGLATLVVGCPCALVISTPVAIVTAIGNSAKQGILIKGGVYLEKAGKLNSLAFDKTGTLTKGMPAVTDILPEEGVSGDDLLTIIYHVEKQSNHPLAKTLVSYTSEHLERLKDLPIANVEAITGKGVKADINGETVFAASPSYVQEHYPHTLSEVMQHKLQRLEQQGKTTVVIGTSSRLYGLAALRDDVREEARVVVSTLEQLGISELVMLTGDQRYTAEAIGQEAGGIRVMSNLLPDEKLLEIKSLKKKGKTIAMVGDGMNDAPALARADLGIAMGGTGTDTALETADIALMSDDLKKIPYLIKLSRKTLTIIKQNIAFSLGLKLLALMLIPFGWLTLWIAIIADMGATLLVTLNSLRLLKK